MKRKTVKLLFLKENLWLEEENEKGMGYVSYIYSKNTKSGGKNQ